MKFSSKVQKCQLSPVRQFNPCAAEAEAKGRTIYHLNIGQPDIKTPDAFFEAVRNFKKPVLEYAPTPGLPEYLDAVRGYYAKIGIKLDRSDILVTSGAGEALEFVLATILLLVFCLQLKWVGVWSTSNPNYILPVISLAMYPMAYITRLTKSSMLDVLGQDYIRTARAKGVKDSLVIFKHALRNALIPVITYVGPMTAYILTGSMVVETVFTIGGLGTQFVKSINNQDYPMIMATTIFLAVLMVVATLLSDLVYKLVDPRIKLD